MELDYGPMHILPNLLVYRLCDFDINFFRIYVGIPFHFAVLSGRENDSVHIVEDVGFSAFFLHL